MTTNVHHSNYDQERALARVLKAIDAIKAGRMVIMVDDEDRENEGDLVFAASHVNAEKINFMAREARGLICLTLSPDIVDRLELPLMTGAGFKNVTEAGRTTAFTVSIEARIGVSTGISAADRAETIRVAIADNAKPADLVVPGHVFPLRAKSGGVLERAGHTEGSVDIARLAGLKHAGVICEIMRDDGAMARRSDLDQFAAKHNLEIVSIADLITFRLMKESLIETVAEHPVKTRFGTFRGILFKSQVDGRSHFALVKGTPNADTLTHVRVMMHRPLADVFAHEETRGGQRLEKAMQMLADKDNAVVVYMMPSATGDATTDMSAFCTESKPKMESGGAGPMDLRVYGIGAQILRMIGVGQMSLHTYSPRPLRGLSGFGLEVVETVTEA